MDNEQRMRIHRVLMEDDQDLARTPAPLGSALEERLVATVLQPPRSANRAEPTSPSPPRLIQTPAPPPQDTKPERGRDLAWIQRWRRIWGFAVPLAAAASLLLIWYGRSERWGHRDELIPRIEVVLTHSDQVMGATEPSKTPPPSEFDLDDQLNLELRLAEPSPKRLGIHAYLRQGDQLQPWAVRPAALPDGRFVLRGPIKELPGLAPGTWDLVFIIGPTGETPASTDAHPPPQTLPRPPGARYTNASPSKPRKSPDLSDQGCPSVATPHPSAMEPRSRPALQLQAALPS